MLFGGFDQPQSRVWDCVCVCDWVSAWCKVNALSCVLTGCCACVLCAVLVVPVLCCAVTYACVSSGC